MNPDELDMLFEAEMLSRSEMTYLPEGLLRHHPKVVCSGRCPLHFPTNHPMSSWPLHWNDQRGIMERTCEHGINHADPDDLKVWRLTSLYAAHMCDGCCAEVDYWSQELRPPEAGGHTEAVL